MLAEDIPLVDKYNLAWIGIISGVLGALVSLIGIYFTSRYQKRLTDLETAKLTQQAEIARQQSELERLKLQQQRELLELTNKLQEQNAEKDARRDYEYEARKRLYQQCEPLFFQLIEYSESAFKRIRSLARSAKEGDISLIPGQGWLHTPNGYYFTSTVYKLLAPLVVFKLIQQRLTLVDLTVDSHINSLYILSKRIYLLFTDDFRLARIEPELDYAPNAKDIIRLRNEKPEVYMRQAMFIGTLDSVIHKMIVTESESIQRCINYNEFEEVYKKNENNCFADVIELFQDFHPKTRPVFWRVLIAQAYIYETLIQARDLRINNKSNSEIAVINSLAELERGELNWRNETVEATDEEVLIQPFDAAKKYLKKWLGNSFVVTNSKNEPQ
ncbi:MAG: hypothetical protein M3384_13200 [Acidobacteriota bacterium]|nr:hypothetical protein [Acidobacteriota bacterium]